MTRIIHVIDPEFKSRGKIQLMLCHECEVPTLHTTPFFAYPFRCVANHGGTSRCDSCKTYIDHIAKVVVDIEGKYEIFCDLCCEPGSPEKERQISERKRNATIDALRPIDLNDPKSIVRTLGASSYTRK